MDSSRWPVARTRCRSGKSARCRICATFLQNYHAQSCGRSNCPPFSAPSIMPSRNELRELIAFDQQLGRRTDLAELSPPPAGASAKASFNASARCATNAWCSVIWPPLRRARPQGWHTLVYGLTLAVYSLPLRQGLIRLRAPDHPRLHPFRQPLVENFRT